VHRPSPSNIKAIETPELVFAKLNCGYSAKQKNDPRYNAEKGDAFADGHRLVTSPIITVKGDNWHTQDTVYTIDENDKNPDFNKWCEENQYQTMPFDLIREQNEDENMLLRHICENCGKEQLPSSEEGYKQGWDYLPKRSVFVFTLISSRTYGDCGIQETLWWEITFKKTPTDQLSGKWKCGVTTLKSEPR